MLSVHFIRHGKRHNGVIGDPGLTPEGRKEASLLAEAFLQPPPSVIFTSPLARAKQTAEIIGNTLGAAVHEDLRLRERMNWGDVPGQSLEEFLAEWDRCSRERTYEPKTGDSSIGAGRRIEQFLVDCQTRFPDGHVLAVTHGGVLADFLLNVFSIEELNDARPEFYPDPYGAAVVRECSVTTVRCDEEGYQLGSLGFVQPSMASQLARDPDAPSRRP